MKKTNMNTVQIFFSSSNYYVPFLSVAIESLVNNISPSRKYNITILNHEISKENKEIIKKYYKKGNVKINFFDVSEIINLYKFNFYTYGHVSIETYFKLLIPVLFKKYPKCLFFDSDLVFLKDINDLFMEDLGKYALGATHCCLISGLYNYDQTLKHYINNTLGLKNVDNYCQGGVLMFNTNKWNKMNISNILLDSVRKNNFKFVDQCAINKFFNGNLKFLDQKWNYETKQRGFAPAYKLTDTKILNIHQNAKKEPYIIHYSGKHKPWLYPDEEFADIWWQYARKTPFYEEILTRMIQYQSNNENMQNNAVTPLRNELTKIHLPNINNRFIANEYNTKLNYVLEHMFLFKWIKFKYKIEKALSFGEKHERYKRKYKNVKQLIKDAKQLKKQFLNFNY